MNIPWAENNERHQAQGWGTSVMTSYDILWRHMALFDVILCPMTSLRKFLIMAPNGAHCFLLRIRFSIRIHQKTFYISDFQAHQNYYLFHWSVVYLIEYNVLCGFTSQNKHLNNMIYQNISRMFLGQQYKKLCLAISCLISYICISIPTVDE